MVNAMTVKCTVRNTYSNLNNKQKVLKELEAHGIHFHKEVKEDLYFKCDTNPYLPEQDNELIRLFEQIGNIWTYHGSNKTLIIKNVNLGISAVKKQ